MIAPDRADALIKSAAKDLGLESCPIAEAQGRVLRDAITADRPQPPFDRATMDGVAIRTADWAQGTRSFQIAGVQPAGAAAQTLPSGAHAIEIMTGAVMPNDADCVVPVERTSREGDSVRIEDDALVNAGQFIHPTGSDAAEGDCALEAGCFLNGPRIAIAASMGHAQLTVARRPRVAIVSTGDELVDVEESPEPYQIRRSNSYGLAAMLAQGGAISATCHHLRDDFDAVRDALAKIIADVDVLILSGGVSMGTFDHVPGALEAIGAQAVFHKITQRPGKPMWFGRGPADQAIFALPGNPVSALVCARRYVWPYIAMSMGANPTVPARVTLGSPITFLPRLDYFLPVNLEAGMAMPRPANTSGDFVTLGATTGFVQLPMNIDNFPEGYACDYYEWL